MAERLDGPDRGRAVPAGDEDRIVKIVSLPVPVERVWRALTDHREFGAWFEASVDQPFELGKTQTGHITTPGLEHYQWRSTVVTMEEPRVFAFRWPHPKDPAAASYDDDPTTLVTFELTPEPGGTLLTITESGFEAVDEERRAASMRENTTGWEVQAGRITHHLAAAP